MWSATGSVWLSACVSLDMLSAISGQQRDSCARARGIIYVLTFLSVYGNVRPLGIVSSACFGSGRGNSFDSPPPYETPVGCFFLNRFYYVYNTVFSLEVFLAGKLWNILIVGEDGVKNTQKKLSLLCKSIWFNVRQLSYWFVLFFNVQW